MITDEQIKQGLDKAYKQAGHNAYFGNGFEAGVKFALEQVKNITYEPLLATGRKCIHAICSKDDCPFVMNDEIECPLQ